MDRLTVKWDSPQDSPLLTTTGYKVAMLGTDWSVYRMTASVWLAGDEQWPQNLGPHHYHHECTRQAWIKETQVTQCHVSKRSTIFSPRELDNETEP